MKPLNNFIDESAMAPHGEPIEWTGRQPFTTLDGSGLVAHEITMEEFELARKLQQERQDNAQA